ncbi:MAG: hypothetical protein ACI4JF_02610 [Oscillospiraceae bacterium]
MNDVVEKISKAITDTGKAVSEKTKQVGSAAKLNAKIISSEHTVSENYTILGKYYYDTYKDNPDEGAAESVNAITAALESIEEMKAQILALRGAVKCNSCGAECPFENNFCGKCGAALEKPEPVEEEPEEEAPAEVVVVDAEEAAPEEVPADDDNTVL